MSRTLTFERLLELVDGPHNEDGVPLDRTMTPVEWEAVQEVGAAIDEAIHSAVAKWNSNIVEDQRITALIRAQYPSLRECGS